VLPARSTTTLAHVWILVGKAVDGVSAVTTCRRHDEEMRPKLANLAAASHAFVEVVVRTDRLGRNVAEAARARKELTRLGAQIHMIADGGMVGDLPAHIYMAIAQDESKRIGEPVADVRSNLVQSGWFYGRTAFGYRTRPLNEAEQALRAPYARQRSDRWYASMIEPDPITSGVVIDVLQRVSDGASVHSTARRLAAQSSAIRGGRYWSHNSVAALLRSPTYVARLAEGAADRAHPPGRALEAARLG
jgi:hypothetical protein